MGKRSLVPRLNDILRNIYFLEGLTAGKTADDFACDQVHRLAAERAIEIISEASRHIPEQVRAQYQDMPWRSIFSIGNVFRHEYEVLDPAIIWDVATEGVQKLKPVIEDIKAKQTDSSASSQGKQSTSSITLPTHTYPLHSGAI